MGENVDLQQTACMEYQTLQSGLQVVEDDLMSKFNNLRKKIINTDIVIQKYNVLEKKFDVNRKHLEKANLLITKLQKDLNYSDGQLREALLITDPLKKQNAEIVSQNFVLSNKVTNLEEKLIADEKTKQQLEAALKKFKEDAENVEILEAALNKEKKTSEKLAKSKEDAISLKDTLKEARFQYQKLQQKNKTVVKYLVVFGKLLQDRNLLNKAQKRVFIKYSSHDDSKEHSGSDTATSDLDDEGLLIESQLLNSSNPAYDVSIQTENFYNTQCSQTEEYFEISDAILNDAIQQFISIPKALSPLPPSPKRYNKRKSRLDSSNKLLPQEFLKETIVPLECCGCCKKVVRQQEEIDILKSKSCEISRKSQGNSQNTHDNYKEKSGSLKISPVLETVEENRIDNDHSYCSAKADQNTDLTSAGRNEEIVECINTSNHRSEYPPQEPSKRLVKSTLNGRFTVPFFKKGSIFRSVEEDISCPLLETRYKVKFFKKSNLYSEEDESKKKINFGPNLNTRYNPIYALNNKYVCYSYLNKNSCKLTATEENNCTQKRTVTRDSHFQNISEVPENIFEVENLVFDEKDQNTSENPVKISPLVKRPQSLSTTNTTLKRPRVQPGINPLKAREKCMQSLKKSMQIGRLNRNGASVVQAKPPNAKNVINIESGTSAEDYTSPVPKKARLSRCSIKSASSKSLEGNGSNDLNESFDKLMTELFGDEEEEKTGNKDPVTNVIKDVINDICESPRVADFAQSIGKETSIIPSISIEIKSNDLQNNTSAVESVHISEVDEPVVASLNEQPINNSTDELISNDEKIDISLTATPAAAIRENSTEIIYKLTWNSLLSKNIFAKRQHIQKNEMKSGSEVIKSVIQVMASLSNELLNAEHIWKGMVHRLEEAFSNHSLDVNLLVIELSNWIQTNPIETLDFRTGLPVASTNFSSFLTEEEIKCSILTKYLKTSSFGERYLNSININFTDAMMNQSNMAKKCALCRFLMYLHKVNKNMEAARILCYDVMYHFTSSPGAVLTYMFSIWPEAFMDNSAKRSCIMKTICLLLRKEHAELGISIGFLNIFQRFFHSDSTTDDLDNRVILLLHQIGHDKYLYFEAAKSIELIAKVKHWNWTKILIQRLLQILSRNGWKLLEKKDLMPEHLVKANLLYLLGCLGKQSPLEDTETNRNILKIAKLFISTPKEPFCIKETAALVSVMLIKFDQGAAIFMVQKWLPYNKRRISESLKMLLIKHNLWSS